MAELTALLSKIKDDEVENLLQKYEVNTQVDDLKKMLEAITDSLKVAERKSSGNESLKNFMNVARVITYETEDALDKFLIEAAKNPDKNSRSNRLNMGILLGKPKKASFAQAFIDELNKIKKKTEPLTIPPDGGSASGGEMEHEAPVQLQPDDVDAVVSVENKEYILKVLLDEDSKRLSFISITGQAGLGKTTLARFAYNSKNVKRHFDVQIWIAVSSNYKLFDLLKMIGRQLHNRTPYIDLSEERLGQIIGGSLKGKKYLIILDGVRDNVLWTDLKGYLPDEEKGSRVLITTRHTETTQLPVSRQQYELPPLTDEQSQQLLLKSALANNRPEDELTDICNQLAQYCEGFPLALLLLGGILSKVGPTSASWSEVLQTIKSKAEDPKRQKIVSCSYDELSFTLKSCFLYCAAFPENYQIDAKSLIRMWVAEGFIPQEENKTMEETSAEFLDDLVQRRMIQVSRRSIHDGAIISCHIHNLLHDLAVKKAREENFLTIWSSSAPITYQTRRMAVHDSEVEAVHPSDSTKSMNDNINPNLRSVLYFESTPNCSTYKLLKVLGDMRETPKDGFQNGSSMELTQLRYCEVGLKLESTIMAKFISELKYLQTLDLRQGQHGDLPDSIWCVKALRHIMLSGYTLGPTSEADLSNLQTLTGVKTRPEWESKLPKIPNVRELDIKLNGVFPWEQIATFLAMLNHLISLRLCGTDDFPLIVIDMRSFQFYGHLKSLYLLGDTPFSFEAHMFPTKLTELTLDYFLLRRNPIPVLEQLQLLKRLCLKNAFEIKEMRCSAGGFCMLEDLQLFWLQKLETLEIQDGAMRGLKELTVTNCHMLCKLEGLEYLKNLQAFKLSGVSMLGKEDEIRRSCHPEATVSIMDLVDAHGVTPDSVKDEYSYEDAKATIDEEE